MIRLNLESVGKLVKQGMDMLHQFVLRKAHVMSQKSSIMLQQIEAVFIRMESQLLSVGSAYCLVFKLSWTDSLTAHE